jgi:hypothetical protein
MYLGNKSMKFDNVNGIPERKWNGPGGVATGISQMQADKLCAHKEEFLDVTGMTEKEVLLRASKARADSEERVRKLHRSTGPEGAVMLEYATDEQLQAEIDRRRKMRGIQDAAPPDPVVGKNKGGSKKPATEKSKSQKMLTEAVEETLGKLLDKNDPDDFKDGIPTKVAVERELGFQLTDDEFAISLGSKAPAEEPDKSGFNSDGPAARQ